ncbi:integrase [Roseibium sp. TrichSKD4]|uniref:site-specific integrase n=1 Tax=Roseibium sp. TrichSKD4 TaxID=744980 RepID=UPI0001E56651|nr:site-specific integrase [Roseibium sp. TrichSKD4]EFO33563.1 integrase [Roseibium sp. TrichSKD4]
MPRPKKPPRLWLRKGKGGAQWVILDGTRYIRTGCPELAIGEAEKKPSEYIAEKYTPKVSGDPQTTQCAEVMLYYATHRVPQLSNPRNEADFLSQLSTFWGGKFLSQVSKETSREYAALRLAEGVSSGTARRELESFRSAVNYYVDEHQIAFRPKIELPEKAPPRDRWLTRSEAAAFVHAARRRGNHHLARLILIGLYTGTRTGAIIKMRWLQSIDAGWFDLENGVMYRRGQNERLTNKRRPSVRIPNRLLPHLKRWKKLDGICVNVIHRDGLPIKSARKAWANSRDDANLGPDVVPHVLRHTCASWGMQNIVNSSDLPVLASFLGMSLKVLIDVYGHHNPEHQQGAINAISVRPGAKI